MKSKTNALLKAKEELTRPKPKFIIKLKKPEPTKRVNPKKLV